MMSVEIHHLGIQDYQSTYEAMQEFTLNLYRQLFF